MLLSDKVYADFANLRKNGFLTCQLDVRGKTLKTDAMVEKDNAEKE